MFQVFFYSNKLILSVCAVGFVVFVYMSTALICLLLLHFLQYFSVVKKNLFLTRGTHFFNWRTKHVKEKINRVERALFKAWLIAVVRKSLINDAWDFCKSLLFGCFIHLKRSDISSRWIRFIMRFSELLKKNTGVAFLKKQCHYCA